MPKINLDNKKYILRRYENKMIRVFDDDNNILATEVLPLLKALNQQYNLGIPIKHSTGTPKKYSSFGKEIISAINKLNISSKNALEDSFKRYFEFFLYTVGLHRAVCNYSIPEIIILIFDYLPNFTSNLAISSLIFPSSNFA